jgi:hypothetical protein
MLAFLLVVLAAAPLPTSAKAPARGAAVVRIPADGRVVTPEGIRFRLPSRLAYSVHEEDGRRVYAAKSADETTHVAVNAFLADSELPCDADQEDVEVDAFETTHGLRACRIVGGADDEPLALAIVYLESGRTFVTVTVIAPRAAAAELAASVAESVETASPGGRGDPRGLARVEIPRPEPRLVGCFERDASVPEAAIFWQRCFEEDLSFTQRYGLAVRTSSPIVDRQETDGAWLYAGGKLLLRFADASERELTVHFEGEDLYLDGDLWKRM